MRDVRQWLRELRRSPANHVFMLVSWSLSLAGGLVALSLASGHVRFLATLTAMLAGIAIVLAAAGLHGLTEHWVYASQRELGIRRAVGATDRSVIAWFARRWLRVVGPAVLAGCGIHIGLLLAASANIEGVTPASIPQSLAGATAILLYAGGVATAALRLALRTDTQQLIR